ncbi:ExbD/TolR family protein [Gimesia aquarii]|uniref:Biopolymer transport protein ExbD n=1 Tax=Gimesia aquarii TaxID=2527964 RepID=A0A517WZU5_9PLAN|nr:biopolymer transporter ExbD [Gimesia aquarii]QDU10777.1 biopolymer transport protein ExbD [Gimesia aquarii]
MPIKFYCQKCGQKLSVASKKAGKSVSCPACQRQITIPLKSEDRRTEVAEKTPKAPPNTEKTPQTTSVNQEENQLLDDLDDLGPLGESWDEILEGDWEQAAAAEETAQPVIEKQVEEKEKSPPSSEEKQETKSQPEPVPELDTSESEERTPQSEPEMASQKIEAKTPSKETATVPPTKPRNDVEEDEDDDEAFSIRSAESEFEEMDLTPMVDVTFLLLIFFMITASFSLQKSIQVPPPNPDEDGVSQSLQTLDDFREESIIVEIDNNNGIYVDDIKLSNPSEIVQAILDRRDQGGKPKSELVLSAHNAARHETVVAVVDAANEVGMQKIRLASYRGPED